MTRYAENTQVPADRSRAEIEKTLRSSFFLIMPEIEQFKRTPTGRGRNANQTRIEHEKAQRQGWRALALVIKAKLEAIESGITTFDQEFLAHIQLPTGETVGDWMVPQVEHAYETGKMPRLLPAAGRRT